MPLFIFISGLFDHPRDRFPINKVAFYIVLGFLYKLLNFYVGLSLGHYSFLLLGDSGAPWFMFSMAAWVSLTWLLRRFPLWPVLATSLALSLAVGYDSSIGDYLYLSRIITLFPFYWIAYKLHPERVVETVQSRRCFALGVIVLIAWGVVCFARADLVQILRPMFTWRNSYASLAVDADYFWRAAVYVTSGLLICAHLGVFLNIGLPCFMAKMGSRTLPIYFWHEAVKSLVYVSGLYNALFYIGPIGKLLVLAIGIFSCWLLSLDVFVSSLEHVRKLIMGATSARSQ